MIQLSLSPLVEVEEVALEVGEEEVALEVVEEEAVEEEAVEEEPVDQVRSISYIKQHDLQHT